MVKELAYIDFCEERNKLFYKGGSFIINLKKNDSRLKNIKQEYKDLEKMAKCDFVESCVSYIVYDIKKDKYYVSDKMFFVTLDGEDICFGRFTVEEKESILKDIFSKKYFTKKFKEEYLFEVMDLEEFKEVYSGYFRENIFDDINIEKNKGK